MATGSQEIRFGVVAVEKGFVTPKQVVEALRIQVAEDLSAGEHRAIGEILLADGVINRSQLDEVLMGLERLKKKAQNARKQTFIYNQRTRYLRALKSINEALSVGLQKDASKLEIF